VSRMNNSGATSGSRLLELRYTSTLLVVSRTAAAPEVRFRLLLHDLVHVSHSAVAIGVRDRLAHH
jgi:hypothetical protein